MCVWVYVASAHTCQPELIAAELPLLHSDVTHTYADLKTHLDLLLQEVDFVLLLQELLLLPCNLETQENTNWR